MSIDDRKSKNDVNAPGGDNDVEDLKAKKVTEPEAEQVKGGLTDFSFTKHVDKPSTSL